MKQVVKIMADKRSSDVYIEADTHGQAVLQLRDDLMKKNDAGRMMSESIVIFDESGIEAFNIENKLLNEQEMGL